MSETLTVRQGGGYLRVIAEDDAVGIVPGERRALSPIWVIGVLAAYENIEILRRENPGRDKVLVRIGHGPPGPPTPKTSAAFRDTAGLSDEELRGLSVEECAGCGGPGGPYVRSCPLHGLRGSHVR